MRISATIKVSNRSLASLNMSNKRPGRSHLSIGLMPGKNKDPYLLHQTQHNAAGVKYKIKRNIQTVFTRFIHEGKFTIRVVEPAHDLTVECSPTEAKNFVKTLRLVLQGHVPGSSSSCRLSDLGCVPKKIPPKPKTVFVVSSKEEYPTLEGFPRSSNTLQINNVEMKRLDTRILRLQELRVLNLEGNLLESLPPQIDLLPSLRELRLANNSFGRTSDWRWLTGNNLRKNLLYLDLSDNELTVLPKLLVKLWNLKALLLQNNNLKYLPNGIGHLSNLKTLALGNNKLGQLPGSVCLLRLSSLDVSDNPDTEEDDGEGRLSPPSPPPPHSLLDLAARSVLISRCGARMKLREDELPRRLIDYLEDASYCPCGTPTFPASPQVYLPFPVKRLASQQVTFSSGSCYIAFRYCSDACCQACTRANNPP